MRRLPGRHGQRLAPGCRSLRNRGGSSRAPREVGPGLWDPRWQWVVRPHGGGGSGWHRVTGPSAEAGLTCSRGSLPRIAGPSAVAVVGRSHWGWWGKWLAPGCRVLGSGGRPHVPPGSGPQIAGPSAVAGHAGSWEGGGSDLHPLTGPAAVAAAVHTYLWSPRWQPRLASAPGAHGGGALSPASAQRKKLLWQAHLLLSCPSQQWSLASLAGPGFFLDSLRCGALHPSPLRLSSHSQPQSSPRRLTSEARASVPSPHLPQQASEQASQARECRLAPTLCAGLSLLCPLHTCCCALL